MCVCACAGPELPLLQQLGRLPINVPSQEAASSTLPPGWRVWHDPLQLFAVINPPFISATSNMNPEGSLHTGHFNMLLYEGLPGVLGRVQALTFLAKAETGSHLNSRSLLQDKVCWALSHVPAAAGPVSPPCAASSVCSVRTLWVLLLCV